MNRNKITEMSQLKGASPELLARYCDANLKVSSKIPNDSELENILNDAVCILKIIQYSVF